MFSDVFSVRSHPFGVTMQFGTNVPAGGMPLPGADQQFVQKEVVRVRMSLIHAKLMVYAMWRNLNQAEHNLGYTAEPGPKILSDMNVTTEVWEALWGAKKVNATIDGTQPTPLTH